MERVVVWLQCLEKCTLENSMYVYRELALHILTICILTLSPGVKYL